MACTAARLLGARTCAPKNISLHTHQNEKLRVADVDLEEYELQPARYKPDRLEVLMRTTGFSKKEIQFVYRAFKQECPTGMISEETFKSIYAKFFPLGGEILIDFC